MALLLRRIRQSRWYIASDQPLPADPLADLNTEDNVLSLWQVQDDGSNLTDIIAAVAATRDAVANVDIALFDSGLLQGIGAGIEARGGRTPLAAARSYHRGLVGLNAQQLIEVAEVIRRSGEIREFSRREVRYLLAAAVNTGRLKAIDLKDQARQHLAKRGLI